MNGAEGAKEGTNSQPAPAAIQESKKPAASSSQLYCPFCNQSVDQETSPVCRDCGKEKPASGWPLDCRLGSLVAGAQYRVLRRVGSGGFGVVYEVETAVGGLRRALKVLNRKWLQDGDVRERFINEALTLERVNHPNVARCFSAGELGPGEELYLLLEFVEGVSVQQLLESEGPEWKPLEPARAVRIALQVASGLVAAHANGILHRDLKPANVLVLPKEGEREAVKLIDFGIAKDGSGAETAKHVFLGTPQFMAPEQFDPSLAAPSAALDLWQLGATLFSMLTGQAPRDNSGSLRSSLSGAPETARTRIGSRMPEGLTGIEGLDHLLRRLLAVDPSRRPSSAMEVCEELAALEHQISPSTAVSPTALLEVLCASPSDDGWQALCRHLAGKEKATIQKADTRLKRWPARLRPAYLSWWESTKRGNRHPLWRLARSLDLSNRYLQDSDLRPLLDSQAAAPLRSLDLSGNSLTDAALEQLASAPALHHLRHLNLGGNPITARGLKALSESPHFSDLREIRLSQTPVGPEGAEVLAGSGWNLTRLALNECGLRTAGAESLARGSFRCLQRLELRGNLLGADGIAALAASSIFLLLRHLDLTRNAAGPSGAASLAMASGLHQLRTLKLAQNNLGKQGLHLLLGSSAMERLETLDISSNSLGPNGALVLASSPLSRRLRRIDLADNRIEDAGLAALLGAPQLTGLRELKVAQNGLTASGVSLLGGAPLQLEALDLSANPVPEDRWGLISEALGKTRVERLSLAQMALTARGLCRILEGTGGRLRSLDVSGNGFDSETEVPAGCFELSSLTNLEMAGCRLTARSLKRLLDTPYLRRLRSLSLSSNSLGDTGCLALTAATCLLNLRELILQDNGIGAAGVRELARSALLGRLTRLDLSFNDLGDKGAETLAREQTLRNLRSLSLCNSGIGMSGIASLTSSPNLSSLQGINVTENPLAGRQDLQGLTQRRIELMESCYDRIARAGTAFSSRFYERLFEVHPRVKPLFHGVSMLQQQQHLHSALVMVIENLRNPEMAESRLRRLGERHVGYGVQPSQYGAVGQILLEVLAETMAEDWSPELLSAWKEGIESIAQVMMNGHRQTRASHV